VANHAERAYRVMGQPTDRFADGLVRVMLCTEASNLVDGRACSRIELPDAGLVYRRGFGLVAEQLGEGIVRARVGAEAPLPLTGSLGSALPFASLRSPCALRPLVGCASILLLIVHTHFGPGPGCANTAGLSNGTTVRLFSVTRQGGGDCPETASPGQPGQCRGPLSPRGPG
jgi:hypothetical protein